ncbi:MAG TPA: 1-aminocyclopropane-1-carboxylate deaminase/D-cysteine desulfhydrase [Ignavibacteria bacterium]|nr:1-aminocyclopropane-1-carboxylate deaminase/D-cysteine desulfhydrase [Ignavibacteria bacterium]
MNLNKISPYPTPLIKLESDYLNKQNVNLYIKRIDLIHPYISGNKWFKLFYNLIEAKEIGEDTLLTFGGAFSNHIYAVAAAGNEYGFKTIGIIRGEKHLPLNPTLRFAESCGMKFYFVNRSLYRQKESSEFKEWLEDKFGNFYLLPEGGTNSLAVKGCSEIITSIDMEFDYICTACGTGGTLAGLVCGLSGKENALGFSVLKGGDFLIKNVEKNIQKFSGEIFHNWDIKLNYHFGGYAKITNELINFVKMFEKNYGVPIEPIYTGKMIYGIFDLIKNNYFKKNSTIIALHTGGMQGLKGLQNKIKKYTSSL